MNRFVNLGMLSHPVNWGTLLVWLVLLGFVVHQFHPKLMGMYSQPQSGG